MQKKKFFTHTYALARAPKHAFTQSKDEQVYGSFFSKCWIDSLYLSSS